MRAKISLAEYTQLMHQWKPCAHDSTIYLNELARLDSHCGLRFLCKETHDYNFNSACTPGTWIMIFDVTSTARLTQAVIGYSLACELYEA